MASFAPIKGTRAEINATPIVEGQFLLETDYGNESKIYLDVDNSTRIIIGGGGANYIHQLLDVDEHADEGVNGSILKWDTSTNQHRWVAGNFLDGWLRDTNNQIEEPYILAGSTDANFTNLNSNCAYDVFVDVPSGVERPKLEKLVVTGTNAVATFSTITSEQAGTGQQCRVRLRELK